MGNKKTQNYLKRKVSKRFIGLAKKVVELEVNSSCPLFAYQPKLPESVKKLKKF